MAVSALSSGTNPEVIARAAFEEIAAQFPSVQMIEENDAPVEISISIPEQAEVRQKIWLCLQNVDELHFHVGHLWIEWFPCTKLEPAKEFIDAVTGFLSGKYRVIEHFHGKRCFKAELQMPRGGSWKTIHTSRHFFLSELLPFKKSIREVRNV